MANIRELKEEFRKQLQKLVGEPIEVEIPLRPRFVWIHPVTGEKIPAEVEGAKKEESKPGDES